MTSVEQLTMATAAGTGNGIVPRRIAAVNEIRPVVLDYVTYRSSLSDRRRRKSSEDAVDGPESGVDNPTTPELADAIRVLAKEFEERYEQVFRQTCGEIFITPNSAQTIFLTSLQSLFSDGVINWGRVVALLAFSGSVAAQCIEKEMPFLVNQVIDWTSTFMATHLSSWIHENGGWDGLITFYKNGHDRLNGQSTWPSFGTLCTAAFGAISVITLGALLAQK